MRWRLSRWEIAAATAVVAAVCAAYLSLAWYGFDLLDEGYFLTNARRVQLGGLPYRDFDAPYTPGIFYLYAWLLDHVGSSMVVLRTPAVIGRGLTFLLLYVLGRRVMAPFFAALAPLLIVAIDRAPPYWSIHPGWVATPATLAATLAMVRYLDRGRARWLFVTGMATGLAFAFKQNLAAFLLMAALWLLVIAERELPAAVSLGVRRRWWVALPREAVRWASLAMLPLAALYLVRPYLSTMVAALFVAPLAMLSLASIWRAGEAGGVRGAGGEPPVGREVRFYVRPLLVLAGFGLVTVPWVAVLVRALDGRWALLRVFVGQIDPSGYYYGMVPPQWEHWSLVATALALPAAIAVWWAVVGWVAAQRWWIRLPAAALALVAVWAGVEYMDWPDDALPSVAQVGGWLAHAGAAWWQEYREIWPHPTDDLVLYVPSLAFWVGLAAFITSRRLDPSASSGQRAMRLWYLAAGACLLLTQYPRMGYGHIVWSGGLLYLVGAERLHALYRVLVGLMPRVRAGAAGWRLDLLPAMQRVSVALSLTLLPAAATLPYAYQRVDWLSSVLGTRRETTATHAGNHLVPLALPETRRMPIASHASTARAAGDEANVETAAPLPPPLFEPEVWAMADEARPIMGVVELLRNHSEPGEPIFAYPAIPGIYYLADRPNATRFNHLFAGMASPEDEAEMVRQLERVRWVVWDDEGVYNWVRPEDNAPVMAYLREHFGTSQKIGPYVVLQRGETGAPRPLVPPVG